MGGTLQTVLSISTSSLATHSLWREGEVPQRSVHLRVRSGIYFSQASGTVHRLREGKKELLQVNLLILSVHTLYNLVYLLLWNILRGVHAWGFRWPKGERGTHAVVGVANNEQVQLTFDPFDSQTSGVALCGLSQPCGVWSPQLGVGSWKSICLPWRGRYGSTVDWHIL